MHPTLLAVLAVFAARGSCEAPDAAQDATAFALGYGYPLLAFEKFARPQVQTSGVNQIRHARSLSTAANTSVVTPNVDTLYSTAILDLSHEAVSIEPGKRLTQGQNTLDIPSDQFVLFSFYDPFGDNFANAGTGHPDNGKSWVVRQKPANVSSYGIQVDQGQAFVNSPSAYTTLIIRWLVNATNLNLVHTLQDQLLITNTSQAAENQHPWLSSIPGVDKSKSPAVNVLNLLAQYAPASNPTIASDADTVHQKLRDAGVLSSNATSATLPHGVDIDKANQTALAAATSATLNATESVGNGWGTIQLNKTGNFGTDYSLRTSIAAAGYLMLTAPDAIYPTWRNTSDKSSSSSGNIILSQGEALLYTFSAKPPLAQTGFWSLTLYDADNFLVANECNVYGVGDRSNLTYADGALIYGGGARADEQRQFQVLVQPANVAPPANWTANWLPAPEAGQGFHVVLRWYGAEGTLLTGGYEHPRVTKVAAITTQTNGTNGRGSSPGAGRSGAGILSINSLLLVLSSALFWGHFL